MFQILTKLLINKYKFAKNRTFIWSSKSKNFVNIKNFKSIPSKLLLGIEYQKKIVFENTKKFMDGYKSNNVLLWGSRGSGKSTLIKSCFNELSKNNNLKLIQINKENLKDIMLIYDFLEKQELLRFIIFIDDLSFETNDSEYKNIKSILDGNIKEQPDNVILYATSNRRHLMPRDMIENEKSSAIHTDESVEEKVSLSDRFGLWVGFHNISQKNYIDIINNYSYFFNLDINEIEKNKSLEWSITRGNRSGRTAWQYIIYLASEKKIKIKY